MAISWSVTACGEDGDSGNDSGETDVASTEGGSRPPIDPGPLPPATGSEGCGTEAPTGTFQQSVTVLGETRTFFVSIPPSYDAQRRYPLVFGYHGGDDFGGEPMRDYLGLEEVPPLESEIFVYPDARGVNQPGAGGFEYGVGDLARGDDAFFDAIVELMSSSYCIDENRIFATGQSAGGGYVTQLACHRGDVLRAAVPVAANLVLCGDATCSGWGGTHPSLCVGEASYMQMHGVNDWIELNPFGLGTFEFIASAAGCGPWTGEDVAIADFATRPSEPVAPTPCERREGCDREVIWCPYQGEHQIPTWYPESGIDYAEVTMAFFRSH